MYDVQYGPSKNIGFILWMKSLLKWKTIKVLGVWCYQENSVTHERRAIRIGNLLGPVHWQWIDGGDWELERPPPPPPSTPKKKASEI